MLAREAALKLAYEREIFVELIVPTLLTPFDSPMQPILESVRRTQRLLVVEEGTLSLGWGTEVLARAAESLGTRLKAARRVAAQEGPVPASMVLEKNALPDIDDIVHAAQALLE
jgi:pyruvate dehydrogenase E1 component beta subunit